MDTYPATPAPIVRSWTSSVAPTLVCSRWSTAWTDLRRPASGLSVSRRGLVLRVKRMIAKTPLDTLRLRWQSFRGAGRAGGVVEVMQATSREGSRRARTFAFKFARPGVPGRGDGRPL